MQPDDTILRDILTQTRSIAMVGYSNKRHRDSYKVATFLQEQGYLLYPVNPQLSEAEGKPCYSSLREIPGPIDLVNVFRRAEFLPSIIEDAIAIQAKVLWTQLGIIDLQAAHIATEAGLTVIMDSCIKIEHQRLQIPPQSLKP